MTLLKSLESDTFTVLNWFRFNEMKPNQGKCHLLVAENDHKLYDGRSFILLEDAFLENEESARLLGVQVDEKLNFEEHIKNVLKEVNRKLCALMRISKFLLQDKLNPIHHGGGPYGPPRDNMLNSSNSARAEGPCFCHFNFDLVWKIFGKNRGVSMIWGQMTGVFSDLGSRKK